MNAIHELSSLVALTEFDLFGIPPTQLTVEKDIQTEHRPIATLSHLSSLIQFEIHTGIDEYIQMRESELYLCIKVNLAKDSSSSDPKITADDWKKISPVNYLLHSMIKQITFSIGQSQINTSAFYAYLAYIDALTYYGSDAKHKLLTSALWYKDKSAEMDSYNQTRAKFIKADGVDLSQGCQLELIGKLHLDLSFQDRALLGGSTLSITILLNDPKFFLLHDSSLVPTVELLDARLYMHRSKVNPAVVQAHHRALQSATAKYFINRKEIKAFNLQQGIIDGYLNNVQNGVLPRRIYVGFVSNEAFNGKNDLNPYYFFHYGIRHIACYLDGNQYPLRPYSPDFNKKKYIREYFGLFEAANQTGNKVDIGITREEYGDGFTLFGFNFAPDLAEGCTRSGYVSPLRYGTLRIEVKFSQALKEAITAVVFCDYDSLIELPLSRVAIKNFN
jgi:hypothetical protein